MQVAPLSDGRTIRLMDVVEEATSMGLKAPMVIRLQDTLRHRVTLLNQAFHKAIKEENYKGEYRGVFPIKVNQLREVVDEIVSAGKDFNYGLEAGSKPELMIALAMHEGAQRLIICNGYKDNDYMRLALLGRKLGKKIILVYVAFRFEFGYGMGAVVSTIHDVIMTIGIFVLFDRQFNASMVAAILLVMGYSINDTIVVFDRIREELKLNPTGTLRDIINRSLNLTLSRTIITGGTTLLTAIERDK